MSPPHTTTLPITDQQQLALFERHSRLIRAGEIGDHAQPEGVMIDEIMNLELFVEGIGDGFPRRGPIQQFLPDDFRRDHLGRFLPPSLGRPVGAVLRSVFAGSKAHLALNLVDAGAREGRHHVKLNAFACGTTDSEMGTDCHGC